MGAESTFQRVAGLNDGLSRAADLLWPEFSSRLLFDCEAEAVAPQMR